MVELYPANYSPVTSHLWPSIDGTRSIFLVNHWIRFCRISAVRLLGRTPASPPIISISIYRSYAKLSQRVLYLARTSRREIYDVVEYNGCQKVRFTRVPCVSWQTEHSNFRNLGVRDVANANR